MSSTRFSSHGQMCPAARKFCSTSRLRTPPFMTRLSGTCTAPATRQCAFMRATPALLRLPARVHAQSLEAGLRAAAPWAPAAAVQPSAGTSNGSSSTAQEHVSAAAASQLVPAAAAEQAEVLHASNAAEAMEDSVQAAAATSAAAAAEEVGEDEEVQQDEEGVSEVEVDIRPVSSLSELQSVAKLRAEAYYADDHSRFAASFKRQFASQEVESLRQRTARASSSGRPQLCECLVAVGGPHKAVLGCIDIRLPATATGMRAVGVPEGDAGGCYLLNVVVDDDCRGQGIGRQLMRAAMQRSVHSWGAERMYTHVEADNEVAVRLYKGCGFAEHSDEARFANTLSLGRLVLLMASADQVPPPESAAADAASASSSSSSTDN